MDTLNKELESAADRVFKPGAPLTFTYGVFNSVPGAENESKLKIVTRIYASGRMIYEGRPIDLAYPPSTMKLMRQARGTVQLDRTLAPGEYVLEVEVTDVLAPGDTPRVAMQHSTFEVRE